MLSSSTSNFIEANVIKRVEKIEKRYNWTRSKIIA